jgi:2-amino-4-hydroxy-6-hydroxymethyldihydropteridine diphosphokinase
MVPKTAETFVALGANLGDPVRQIELALAELSALPHTLLVKHSGAYMSRPVGYSEQPDYVNAVARLSTRLSPRDLLDALLDIEQRHGRVRSFRNAPRTLDLDILLYDGLVMDEPGLHLPHPRLHERAFVLVPFAEIAPETEIPGQGRIAELLAKLDGPDIVRLATCLTDKPPTADAA